MTAIFWSPNANGAPSTAPIWIYSRRRGIKSVVLGGISTNIGVESTARAAREHGYELVIAEDVCSAQNAEMHRFAFEHIFPRLARVRDTGEILPRSSGNVKL